MTDARYPERWMNDRRLRRLSHAGFRSFLNALTWSVANRTDGVIEPDDIELIPDFVAGTEVELVKTGAWEQRNGHWLVMEFADTQTSRDQLEAATIARRKNKDRQQRWRDRQSPDGQSAGQEDRNVTHNVTHNVTKTVITEARPGQDRLTPVLARPDVITTEVAGSNSSSLELVVTNRGTSLGKSSRTRTGSHLTAEWQPSESVKDDLRAKYPTVKLGLVLEEFIDYWLAIPGQRGTKLDWDRTFRNRVREVAHLPRFQRALNGNGVVANNGHANNDDKALGWMALGRQSEESHPRKELT
jgi:hypothetical protein